MSFPMGASKTCHACGADVSAVPRTKDRAGRYFCTPCYEAAVAAQRARGIDQIATQQTAPPIVHQPPGKNLCPVCSHAMSSEDYICTRCGHNPRTGTGLQTVMKTERPVPSGFLAALLWPVYLYVRPDTFFRMFARLDIPGLHQFFAIVLGFAVVADRFDTRATMSQLSGRPSALPDNWSMFWTMVAIGGLISALLYAYIGGWWYRMRLRFSGDANAEPSVARHVFILSWMPYAIPLLIDKAMDTLRFAKPSEARNAPFDIFDALLAICLIWSIWVSFRGVRTVFHTRLLRSVIWFLVLPLVVYGSAFVVMAAAATLTMFAGNPAPLVTMTDTFTSQTWRFEYPGNWFVEEHHPDHHPDNFVIVSAMQDAAFVVDLQEGFGGSVEEMVEFKLDVLRQFYGVVTPTTPLRTWGRLTGAGHSLQLQEGRDLYAGRLFVTDLGQQRMLVVQEVWPAADERLLRPGFDLIKDTFVLHP